MGRRDYGQVDLYRGSEVVAADAAVEKRGIFFFANRTLQIVKTGLRQIDGPSRWDWIK